MRNNIIDSIKNIFTREKPSTSDKTTVLQENKSHNPCEDTIDITQQIKLVNQTLQNEEPEKAKLMMEHLVNVIEKDPSCDDKNSYSLSIDPREHILFDYLHHEMPYTRSKIDFAYIYLLQSKIYTKLNDYDAAYNSLKKAKRWNPCDTEIRFGMADIQNSMNRPLQFCMLNRIAAEHAYKKEDFAKAMYNIGSYFEQKDEHYIAAVCYYVSHKYNREFCDILEKLNNACEKIQRNYADFTSDEIKDCCSKNNLYSQPDQGFIDYAIKRGIKFYSKKNYMMSEVCIRMADELSNNDKEVGKIVAELFGAEYFRPRTRT